MKAITVALAIVACAFSAQAQLVMVVNTNGEPPVLTVESWQSAELFSAVGGGLFRVEKSGITPYIGPDQSGQYGPLVVVGPARVHRYNDVTTFRLSPEPVPPSQAALVPPGAGGAAVTLECSKDLVYWSAATNGVYTNLPVAKFFKVKPDKVP